MKNKLLLFIGYGIPIICLLTGIILEKEINVIIGLWSISVSMYFDQRRKQWIK